MAAWSQVRVLSEAAWGLEPRAPYLAGLFSVQKSFLNKSRWFLILSLNIQNPLHISPAHQGQRKSVVSDRYLKFLSPSLTLHNPAHKIENSYMKKLPTTTKTKKKK